eukprot:12909831-Prorocentrum_lima.AAC.1
MLAGEQERLSKPVAYHALPTLVHRWRLAHAVCYSCGRSGRMKLQPRDWGCAAAKAGVSEHIQHSGHKSIAVMCHPS